MVICPKCLKSTAGENGAEVVCAHCATRFKAGERSMPAPARPTGPGVSSRSASPRLKACAIAPYVAPPAALGIYLAGYDSIGSSMLANSLAMLVYLVGTGAAFVALSGLEPTQKGWRYAAGTGILFSFVGFPLLCVAVIFWAIGHGPMPGA